MHSVNTAGGGEISGVRSYGRLTDYSEAMPTELGQLEIALTQNVGLLFSQQTSFPFVISGQHVGIRSPQHLSKREIPPLDTTRGVACSALARLRTRDASFGAVLPSHIVFADFVPKFVFSGKKVVGYDVTECDPTIHVKSWRTASRSLTKKAGFPGFRFHDLRRYAITALAESGPADFTIMAIAGHVSRRMLERYSHVHMEAKRTARPRSPLQNEHNGGLWHKP